MSAPRPVAAEPVLSVRGLRKEYQPGKPVLKDISLDFAPEGVTAIIGPRARANQR